MKRAIGNCLLGLKSKTGGSVHRTAQSLTEKSNVFSELYFAKSQRHLIDTADTGQFATQEVTVIYLSFTNVRISIALPGRGVSLEAGTSGTFSRKSLPTPFAVSWPQGGC
jgi:hypothetical protein